MKIRNFTRVFASCCVASMYINAAKDATIQPPATQSPIDVLTRCYKDVHSSNYSDRSELNKAIQRCFNRAQLAAQQQLDSATTAQRGQARP